MNCIRTKVNALGQAGQASYLLAAAAAQRSQHAEAYEACGDALQEFRETVREFAQRAIAPHAAEIDRQNTFPASTNLWKDIGDFGLHGEQQRVAKSSMQSVIRQQLRKGACCRPDSTIRLWRVGCWLSAPLHCHGGNDTPLSTLYLRGLPGSFALMLTRHQEASSNQHVLTAGDQSGFRICRPELWCP